MTTAAVADNDDHDHDDQHLGIQQSFTQMPEELILSEILTRLPVKSLLRLKSVSKGWNSVISSPHFAKSHLMRFSSSTNNTLGHYKLLVSSTRDLYSTEIDDDDDDDDELVRIEIKLVNKGDLRHFFLGSERGLVCLRSTSDGYGVESFYVYNPSTRMCKEVESPREVKGEMVRVAYGFGYVSSLDEFKIVVLQFPSNGSKVLVFVYSLKSCKWSKREVVRDARYPLVLETGKLVNEALHWVVGQGWSLQKQCILRFNLVDETIDEVPLPEKLFVYGLFVSDGCLCTWGKDNKCVDVGILKEYGVWESWTKLIEIDGMIDGDVFLSFMDIGGTCWVLTTNEAHEIELCDLNGNQVKHLGVFKHIEVLSYIESLVSPFASERQEVSDSSSANTGSVCCTRAPHSSSSLAPAVFAGLLSVMVALLVLKVGFHKLLG